MLAAFLTDRLPAAFNIIYDQASKAKSSAQAIAVKANSLAHRVFDQIAPRATVRRYIAERVGGVAAEGGRVVALYAGIYAVGKHVMSPIGKSVLGLVLSEGQIRYMSLREGEHMYTVETATLGFISLVAVGMAIGIAMDGISLMANRCKSRYAEWKQRELEAIAN